MAIFFWLIKAKEKSGEYPQYTVIHSGNFNDYREIILGLVAALRHIGITPIFFMDGQASDEKHKTAVTRCKQTLKTIEICNYERLKLN